MYAFFISHPKREPDPDRWAIPRIPDFSGRNRIDSPSSFRITLARPRIAMKLKFVAVVLLLLSAAGVSTAASVSATYSGATPLEWSVRLANSEITRYTNAPKWDYTVGLFSLSLLHLNAATNEPRYVSFAEQKVGSLIDTNGEIRGYKPEEFQLDALNPGKTLLALWQLTHDDRYKKAVMLLRHQLQIQPRTYDGGFWHKQRYTNQMWLDGSYMAVPFYVECGRVFGESNQTFGDVALQLRLIDAHNFDRETGLYYHGWDAAKIQPWADKKTGCSSNFWGRAVGWYAMAVVDTLDYFPTNHPARPQLVALFKKICNGIVKYQDPKTGLWWQVLDQGDRKGNYREATASAMFTYALAKGVNHGYLSKRFAPAADKAFDGIVKNLIKQKNGQWSLTGCCSVAGLGFKNSAGRNRDGSFEYYVSEPVIDNDLKGLGPFILAGIELQRSAAQP